MAGTGRSIMRGGVAVVQGNNVIVEQFAAQEAKEQRA